MANDPIWGVIIIHGVGDTGPGVALEAILPTLQQTNRSGLTEITQPQTHLLPEPTPGLPPKQPVAPPTPQATSAVPLGARFPVHLRRFSVNSPRPGDPSQAAFAEVFWADLSTAGEGTLRLLLRLFTVIFDLRYIPYVAAACPDLYMARWLRFVVYAISWLLCGPIAGFTAFMMYMLAAGYAASKTLGAFNVAVTAELDDRTILALGFIGVVFGLALVTLRRSRKWRGHWSFVMWWIVAAAIGDVLFGLGRAMSSLSSSLWPWETWFGMFVAERLSLDPVVLAKQPFSTHLATLLGVLYGIFLVVGVLTVIAFVVWVLAHCEARVKGLKRLGPALNAAVAATLLQVGLWVIIVPALGAVMLRQWSPTLLSGENPVFVTVLTAFAQNLAFATIIATCAAAVWIWRVIWVYGHPPPYTIAIARRIPRLLAHDVIVWVILIVSLVGTVATVYAVWSGKPRLGGWLIDYRGPAVAVTLAFITIVSALFQKGLRNALHILMDIVSHFYRDQLPVPLPTTAPAKTDPNVFTIQQKLEARFRCVLEEILQLGNVKHLTIVAHSQGTMIAIDVLWLKWARRRLAGVQVDLVTMASPFTHLYQYYFPHRYPPLFVGNKLNMPAWGSDLNSTVNCWLNIYRVDDFVGTHIDGRGSGTFPNNRCIPAGGHTGYWHQREALQAMSECLPGR